MSTFDYIIVGGDTAGSVLASRLSSALPQYTFLMIEAGSSGDPRSELSQLYDEGGGKSLEWDYHTVLQKGLNGKIVSHPQGKVMGGSSAISGRGWTRGPSIDFDQWAVKVGDERWSWAGLLPYFKRSETFYPTLDQKATDVSVAHGFDGPIKVAHSTSSGIPRTYPLRSTTAQAYESVSIPRILDHNARLILGCAEVASSTFNSKRYWSSNNYKVGNNVTTWTESMAERLVFDEKKAKAVQILRNGADGSSNRVIVNARNKVIVASGVQGSAKLLLLSGIGPHGELKKHSIHKICDILAGENYSDHPVFLTFCKLKERGLSLGDVPLVTPECDWTAGSPADWMAWHQHNDIVIQAGKNNLVDRPSIDWLLADGKAHTESFPAYGQIDFAKTGLAHPGGSCITLGAFLMTPTSRGTLTLRSADPKDAPVLDPNLLENDLDRALLIAAGKITMSMMLGPVGQKLGAKEYGIDEAIQGDTSDDAMMARILQTGLAGSHGSGTCAMGLVVDAECRVKGIDGLRVVDASVFPFPISAHHQAIVYAVAEQMAQIIIAEQRS